MRERFFRRKIDDEEIWLDVEGGRFYGMNETASAILEAWRAGVRDPGEIADRLAKDFEVSVDEARQAVETFLAEARTRGFAAD